jgi:hypothetical protein
LDPISRLIFLIAINTPALLILNASLEVLRSAAISGRAMKREVLEKVAANGIQLVTERMISLSILVK